MTEFKAPSERLKVGDREILMSYARLLRVIALFPEGLTELTTAHADPAVSAAIVEILLAEKGVDPKDYLRVEDYDLSMEEGDKIAEWGLAHAFAFFARKVEATLEAAKASGQIIKGVTEKTEAMTNSMLSSDGTPL